MIEQKILIAGARGMVGSALQRALLSKGCFHLLTPTRAELDFQDQRAVREYLQREMPSVVIVAAAKVGGILANMSFPADFLYENLMMECNLIHEAHKAGVNRLLFFASSCIYPKFAPQPLVEESLLTAPLEPTNEAYALAKIAGVKLAQFYSEQYGREYFSLMPTNLYGRGDNYHSEHSHVIPGLLRRFHEAKVAGKKEVVIWGTGQALREFLYVDDLAEAALFVLERVKGSALINVGSKEEVTILELSQMIAKVVGYEGKIVHDLSKPDGTPRKKCDLSKLSAMGWEAKMGLTEGLGYAYKDFLESSRK